jgi:hypothetical protein
MKSNAEVKKIIELPVWDGRLKRTERPPSHSSYKIRKKNYDLRHLVEADTFLHGLLRAPERSSKN